MTHFSQSSLPRPLLLTPLLLLAAACLEAGSAIPSSPPVVTPDAWRNAPPAMAGEGSAQSALAPLATWWARLGDPVLDELVRTALASSPDLRSTLSRIEQARASRALQRATLLPSLSVGASGRASRTSTASTTSSPTDDSYSSSLDAAWEIDLFGRQRKALSAAEARKAVSVENYSAAQASLAAEVATAYINLRSAQQRLAVARENLALREQTHELTLLREKAGRASALDTLQSTTGIEQTRAALPALELSIAEGRNQLALLAGKPPGTFDTLLAQAAPVPSAPASLSLAIPADTLRQRPDVRAAELSLRAASAESSAARRARLPSLNLSGSFGVNSLVAERLFRPEATALALIGSLSAPLFDGGRIRQNITIATEAERQALNTWEGAILKALSEVENALVSIRRGDEQLEHLNLAASSASEAARLAALEYEAGMTDLLTVLDTQRTALSARDQLTSAVAARSLAHVQLYKSLGGGWTAR